MFGLKLFVSFMLTSLGILFIKKQKRSSWSYLFSHHPTRAIWYYPLEKKSHAMSLGYMLSLIKFCDPSWFYSIYALDLRFYVQMNLVLLKYCLTIVLKKRERERWKDGMPKKHDPKKRERKDGMPKKHDPANKVRHEKEHVFICALT